MSTASDAASPPKPKTLAEIKGFDGYLSAFGKTLGRKANASLAPLHVPGRDPLPDFTPYTRKPYEPQAHLVAASVKMLDERNAGCIIGGCGTGKTIMAILAFHAHAGRSRRKGGSNGKYRAIVICPNHLIKKWCREIAETIPGAIVRRFGNDGDDDFHDDSPKQPWKDFLSMLDFNAVRRMPGGFQHEIAQGARWVKPAGAEWYVVGRNQFKLQPQTRAIGEQTPCFDGKSRSKFPARHMKVGSVEKKDDAGNVVYKPGTFTPVMKPVIEKLPVCPKCGQQLVDDGGKPLPWVALHRKSARLWLCQNKYLVEKIADERNGQTGRDRILPDDHHTFQALKPGREIRKYGKTWIVEQCDEPLWQWTRKPNRWPICRIIHRRMPGFFDYMVEDEAHETKDAKAIQSKASSMVWSRCRRMLALTGTFINGYAKSIFALLWRISPRTLVQHGFEFGDEEEFTQQYGRVDTIYTSSQPITTIKMKGTGRNVAVGKVDRDTKPAPGVMPALFSQMVMPCAMFITLEQLADELPHLTEVLDEGCIDLPTDVRCEYERIEATMIRFVAENRFSGGTKFLSTMIQTLLAYPDHPWGWNPLFDDADSVGYWEQPLGNPPNPELMKRENFKGVVTPHNFDLDNRVMPKEEKLVEICKRHIAEGSQVWVYLQQTNKRNVMPRLQKILGDAGIRAGILNASDVEPVEREDWIRENGHLYQVIMCYPKLVSTGLDLFLGDGTTDGYKYNYSVLVFFECGYNLFDLRQAASRSWRLGQVRDCLVYYLYYADTMEHRAMDLMSRKLEAALQLEGEFCEDGLAALSSDSSAQMALCKALSARIDDADIKRKWAKVKAGGRRKAETNPYADAEPNPDLLAIEGREKQPEPEPEPKPEETELPVGTFRMAHPKRGLHRCRIVTTRHMAYIEAFSIATPTAPPVAITASDVKRDKWTLEVSTCHFDTLVELQRHGFTFSPEGQSETRKSRSKVRTVGEVPPVKKTGSLKPEEIDALKDITLGDALFDDDGMEFYDSPFDMDDAAEETGHAFAPERAEEIAKMFEKHADGMLRDLEDIMSKPAEEDDVRFRVRDDEGQPLGTVCAGTPERAEERAREAWPDHAESMHMVDVVSVELFEWRVHQRLDGGKLGEPVGTISATNVVDAAMLARQKFGEFVKLGKIVKPAKASPGQAEAMQVVELGNGSRVGFVATPEKAQAIADHFAGEPEGQGSQPEPEPTPRPAKSSRKKSELADVLDSLIKDWGSNGTDDWGI